jgi:toxin ParE1/3/4
MSREQIEVELTQGAEDDLEAIYDYIYDYIAERSSVDEAEALLEAYLEKIDTLEQFPLRGTVPKELDALGVGEFRQILLSP